MKSILALGLLFQIVLAQYRPSTAPGQHAAAACLIDVQASMTRLKADGHRIVSAILNKETDTLLGYFHPDGVTVGVHQHLSKKEVEKQLRSRSGEVYAAFFETEQLRKLVGGIVITADGEIRVNTVIRSVYDYFKDAEYVAVKPFRVTDIPLSKDLPLWAVVSFQWKGQPPQGVYYDPIFICTEKGWKFSTFFNTP